MKKRDVNEILLGKQVVVELLNGKKIEGVMERMDGENYAVSIPERGINSTVVPKTSVATINLK